MNPRSLFDQRIRFQMDEAFGSLNRWYCSEAHHCPVDDKDLLLTHYIKAGGAADFAERFEQAMGDQNRWYCSEYYHHDVRDPKLLWDYYLKHYRGQSNG